MTLRVRKDLSAETMHTATPANPCCGYVGVLLGTVTSHTYWSGDEAQLLVAQEVQCPKCGAKGVMKATGVARQHWPDVDEGASEAEQAFAVYAAERAVTA